MLIDRSSVQHHHMEFASAVVSVEAAQPKAAEGYSWARVRRVAAVARSLHSRPFAKNHRGAAADGHIWQAGNGRAFRRAFVELSIRTPFAVQTTPDGVVHLALFESSLATIDRTGGVQYLSGHHCPHKVLSLAPNAIAEVARYGFRAWVDAVQVRYVQLAGEGANAPSLETDRGWYADSRFRAFSSMARGAVRSFCTALHPEGLRIARAIGAVDWQNADACEVRDKLFLRNDVGDLWRQAFSAYPLAMSMFVSASADAAGSPALASLIEIVESRQRLAPFLQERLSLDRARLRRLQGVWPQQMFSVNRASGLLAFLRTVPLHLWPTSRRDAQVAGAISELAWKCSAQVKGATTADFIQSMTKGMKGPLGLHRRLLGDEPAHAADMVYSLLGPGPDRRQSAHHEQVQRLLSALTIKQLLELSRRWHRTVVAATAEANEQLRQFDDQLTALTWPGVLPEKLTQLPARSVAIELSSPAELLQEGEEMGHCVGGYYNACMDGRSRIVSLRSVNGVDRSTVELQLSTRGAQRHIIVAQHYSAGNEPPSAELKLACRELLTLVRRNGRREWPVMKHGRGRLSQARKKLEEIARGIQMEHEARLLSEYLQVQ